MTTRTPSRRAPLCEIERFGPGRVRFFEPVTGVEVVESNFVAAREAMCALLRQKLSDLLAFDEGVLDLRGQAERDYLASWRGALRPRI